MSHSSLRYQGNVFLVLIFTVGIFILLVKLGLWQLHKGYDKQAWQQQQDIKHAREPLNWDELALSAAELHGHQAQLTTTDSKAPLIVLDNQILQGQVGYRIFQVQQQPLLTHAILIELGFVAASPDRNHIPPLTRINSAPALVGRLYYKQTNRLSQALAPEALLDSHNNKVIRIQNLNLAALAQYLSLPLLPVVLLPTELSQPQWPRVWQSPPMSVAKHFGYALQWFAMALVFAGLVLALSFKHLKQHKDEA
ncbi:MAG: SURF1 family protein [Shewanella sp.]